MHRPSEHTTHTVPGHTGPGSLTAGAKWELRGEDRATASGPQLTSSRNRALQRSRKLGTGAGGHSTVVTNRCRGSVSAPQLLCRGLNKPRPEQSLPEGEGLDAVHQSWAQAAGRSIPPKLLATLVDRRASCPRDRTREDMEKGGLATLHLGTAGPPRCPLVAQWSGASNHPQGQPTNSPAESRPHCATVSA